MAFKSQTAILVPFAPQTTFSKPQLSPTGRLPNRILATLKAILPRSSNRVGAEKGSTILPTIDYSTLVHRAFGSIATRLAGTIARPLLQHLHTVEALK